MDIIAGSLIELCYDTWNEFHAVCIPSGVATVARDVVVRLSNASRFFTYAVMHVRELFAPGGS